MAGSDSAGAETPVDEATRAGAAGGDPPELSPVEAGITVAFDEADAATAFTVGDLTLYRSRTRVGYQVERDSEILDVLAPERFGTAREVVGYLEHLSDEELLPRERRQPPREGFQ